MIGLTGNQAGNYGPPAVKAPAAIDPLRRVFVPREIEVRGGGTVFQTLDQRVYSRDERGTIRRATPKVNNGKAAKRLRAAQRRKEAR